MHKGIHEHYTKVTHLVHLPKVLLLQVLWKFSSGQKPETLGANTRIYNWMPQNDLLGE